MTLKHPTLPNQRRDSIYVVGLETASLRPKPLESGVSCIGRSSMIRRPMFLIFRLPIFRFRYRAFKKKSQARVIRLIFRFPIFRFRHRASKRILESMTLIRFLASCVMTVWWKARSNLRCQMVGLWGSQIYVMLVYKSLPKSWVGPPRMGYTKRFLNLRFHLQPSDLHYQTRRCFTGTLDRCERIQ